MTANAGDLNALLTQLVRHLEDETAALVAGDADRAASIATDKNTLLQRIAPLAQRAGTRVPHKLLEQARQLNDRNAMLLAPRLVATRARLDALRQAGNPVVYGADGRSQTLGAAIRA